jgi:hypothetical protein
LAIGLTMLSFAMEIFNKTLKGTMSPFEKSFSANAVLFMQRIILLIVSMAFFFIAGILLTLGIYIMKYSIITIFIAMLAIQAIIIVIIEHRRSTAQSKVSMNELKKYIALDKTISNLIIAVGLASALEMLENKTDAKEADAKETDAKEANLRYIMFTFCYKLRKLLERTWKLLPIYEKTKFKKIRMKQSMEHINNLELDLLSKNIKKQSDIDETISFIFTWSSQAFETENARLTEYYKQGWSDLLTELSNDLKKLDDK